jgi:glycosyltransferase involved in cell wall biosynthesis
VTPLDTSTQSALISVVIPVFNGERYVIEAIESVRRQASQGIEIIVVDDGSTDRTGDLVRALGDGVRYVRQPNRGPAAARNHGLRLALGEIVALLDADDLWPADKLALQLPYLLADPGLEIVLGKTRYFRRPAHPGAPDKVELSPPLFVIQLGCCLFRRAVFDRVGRFDETMCYAEDIDWFMRSRERQAKTILVDACTIHYRRHDGNMTIAPGHTSPSLAANLKRSLDRRRRLGLRGHSLAPWPPPPEPGSSSPRAK